MEHAEGYERRWWILGVLCLSLLVIGLDNTILNVAIPTLVRDLGASNSQLQWIVDAYTLVFACLLLTAGSLSDKYGRRSALALGLMIFGFGSMASAFAGSATTLIFTRALMGFGGALIMPSTLSILTNVFPAEERGRAIGIWAGVSGLGIGIGPVVGGWLLTHFWWGSVFLINIPFMVLLLALAPALVPEFRAPQAGRFDLISSVLSLGAVLPTIYGIKEIAANGLDLARCLWIAAGVAVGAAFAVRQLRSPAPMIDLRLFRSRGFTGSVAMNLVAMFAIVGFAIFTTQYLQSVLGMSPLTAALWSLVPMAGTTAAAMATRVLVQRVDRAYVAAGGFFLSGAGFAALTQLRVHSPIAFLLIAATIYAGGIVGVMTVGNELIMGAVPPERAGAAAAVVETATEFGAALGIAVLGSAGIAAYRSSLAVSAPAGTPPAALAAARDTLGGAVTVAGQLPGRIGTGLLEAARAAFTHGLNNAALGAAILMVLAAAASAVFFRGVRVESAPAAAGEPQAEPDGQLATR